MNLVAAPARGRTLDWPLTALLVLLCLPYLISGVSKFLDFGGAVREFSGLGIPAPAAAAAATVAVQLLGSAMIVFQRGAWLGAAALAVFTMAATLIAHAFWRFEGQARFIQTNIFIEHVALTAALLLVALLDLRRRRG